MNEEIREYLSKPNPDFETGFSLFCRYSRNQSLMSWIGRKKDMARLLFELQKLEKLNLQVNPQAAILAARYNTPVSAIGQRVTGPGPQITFKTFDERRTRRKDLSDRASFRERLLISQNKIEEGWKQIDAWLLEQEKAKSNKGFNASSYRSYITKMLKKGDGMSALQRDTVRVRAKALIDAGEVLGDKILSLLKQYKLI